VTLPNSETSGQFIVLLQFTGSASECKMITFNQMFAQPGVKKKLKNK